MSWDVTSVCQYLLNMSPPSNQVSDQELARLQTQTLISKLCIPKQETIAEITGINSVTTPNKCMSIRNNDPFEMIDLTSDQSASRATKAKQPSSFTLSSTAQLSPPPKRATILRVPLTIPDSSSNLKPYTTEIMGILASMQNRGISNATSPHVITSS